MTAVKEQFMQMLPQSLSEVPDDEVRYMINILVKWNGSGVNTKEDVSYRIGVGKGEFEVPEDFDAGQDEIYAEMERYALS